MTKGPQTIEKAKQGAYVAKSVSSLQKIRNEKGEMQGIIYKSDGSYIIKPFVKILDEIIQSNDPELLRHFMLSVGIVSNHGNWIKKDGHGGMNFSQENFQKELLVLAQSYDWLLFLTDQGLAEFIENLLLTPQPEYLHIREIFLASYAADKTKNQFTKVKMNIDANRILLEYFRKHIKQIEGWFQVVSPSGKSLETLQREIEVLKNKDWLKILV